MPGNFLFTILILLSSIINNNASSPFHSPRRIEGTFSFEMIVDQKTFVKNEDLHYWLPLPTDSEYQKNVNIISIDPQPNQVDYNSKENLRIGFWDFSQLRPKESYKVKIGLKADLYKVDFFLDPEMVLDEYDQVQAVLSEYTKSDSLAFITPEIMELANELTRNVSDPFLKARNVYRWVLLHLKHKFPITQRGTKYLFDNPLDSKQSIYSGDSAEYSWVFVALCRAVGIPARSVTGFLTKPGWEVPHTWAEFFLPEWGWLPADAYLGDSKELLAEFSGQSDNYFYLGHLDNYHLAFYKGSGFVLPPECPYPHKPFIFNNSVWYAPIGIWNFDKFPNASANFIVAYNAMVTNKYENPEYGIEMKFPEAWFNQSEIELGSYILKERFLTEDKLVKLDFVGRKLPASLKNIDSKEAAKLEIKALKNSIRTYQIISEQPLQIGDNHAYQFIAKSEIDNELVQEYRVYIVKKGYLFWLIGSSSEEKFENNLEKFQTIAKSLKLELPEGFR
jgi:hypothetical protein